MLTIPCDPTLTNYEIKCILGDDGRAFWLRFYWNTRDEGWYLTVSDADRNVIAASMKIVANWTVMGRLVDPAAPAGVFFAIDTSRQGLDPGISDLGDRVQLTFASLAEMAAAVA